jgi:hypothetical protein
MEPPFRVFVKRLLRLLPLSPGTREVWSLSSRPAYLSGLYAAAQVARAQDTPDIIAIEFGVAGGQGLLALQTEAEAVEKETGIGIKVVGFDSGVGLPEPTGDHRDHPDYWREGDFPLDEPALRRQLSTRTRLILGDVKDTVPKFVEHMQDAPVGFVSFDLDLYSSTVHAFQLFTHSNRWMLRKVPLYFDDVEENLVSHRFAGELLAIDEFNDTSASIKIDRWRGIKTGRPFPEQPFLDRMYVAYDLDRISGAKLERDVRHLPLQSRRLNPAFRVFSGPFSP